MNSKKAYLFITRLLSSSVCFVVICLLFICSSCDLLAARATLRAQRQTPKIIRQSNPQLTRTIGQQSPQILQARQAIPENLGANLDSNLALNKKQNLSFINQKFHEFTNALFRYDAQMATIRTELALWQQCLSIDFEKRSGNCADLTDTKLKQKIELLNIKIDELTEDKNRIVTLQDAFKKYWYVLIPIFAAGSAFAAHTYTQSKKIREMEGGLSPNSAEQTLSSKINRTDSDKWKETVANSPEKNKEKKDRETEEMDKIRQEINKIWEPIKEQRQLLTDMKFNIKSKIQKTKKQLAFAKEDAPEEWPKERIQMLETQLNDLNNDYTEITSKEASLPYYQAVVQEHVTKRKKELGWE